MILLWVPVDPDPVQARVALAPVVRVHLKPQMRDDQSVSALSSLEERERLHGGALDVVRKRCQLPGLKSVLVSPQRVQRHVLWRCGDVEG